MEKNSCAIVGITMGDPTGIGPEIIIKALSCELIYKRIKPLVFGSVQILEKEAFNLGIKLDFNVINYVEDARFEFGTIDIIETTKKNISNFKYAHPTKETSMIMLDSLNLASDFAISKKIDAIATCPINKLAMKMAGAKHFAHTEFLADKCNAKKYAMLFAGKSLKVLLATIHIPLKEISSYLSKDFIIEKIKLCYLSLKHDFKIKEPKILVAGLNPHNSENGMFGDEEEKIIFPAILDVQEKYPVVGPVVPDIVFYKAIKEKYDAVIAMYHDQGLIPFKMLHFEDGVNMTIGLPIIRTSVDHGVAYDICGQNKANPASLISAILLAAECAKNRKDL